MLSHYIDTLGIFYHSPRSAQLVNAVLDWATDRQVTTVVKRTLAELNEYRPTAIYIPTFYVFDALHEIYKDISIIIDLDCGVRHHGDSILQWFGLFAKDRIVSARVFSVNYDTVCDTIFQVPYAHCPLKLDYGVRDVVFTDMHDWEGGASHLQVLADLKQIERFGDFVYYYNMRDLPNMLTNEHCFTKNVIQYLDNFSEFCKIFARLRLFVSNHTWLNDLDVFNAYISGAPIWSRNLTVSRGGYFHPRWKAMTYLEPALRSEFANITQHWQFAPHDWRSVPAIRDDIPIDLYRHAYYRLWDILWEWVRTGRRDKILERLTVHYVDA